MKPIEFKVKAADFLTAAKRVKHCIGENESRRNLMGINLSVSENDLTRLSITAADGFRIARQSIEVTPDSPFNVTIDHYPILNRTLEKYLKQYEKTEKFITCKIEGVFIHLDIPETEMLSLVLRDEEYPTDGINRLLANSESSTNQITIRDVNSFYRAAEYIYSASDSCRQAVIKLSLSRLRKDGCNDQKTVSLAMGININNVHFREALFNIESEGNNTETYIGLNVGFLKEALKVFKTLKAERLILSYKDRESPCFMIADSQNDRLSAGYTFQQVILPVKLKY